jgi:hypothetical protein
MGEYAERFGKLPPYFVGDTKYGTRRNRADLETLSVRPSFKPLGRAAKKTGKDPWFRKKQKERNRIEGAFGNGKEHYSADPAYARPCDNRAARVISCKRPIRLFQRTLLMKYYFRIRLSI